MFRVNFEIDGMNGHAYFANLDEALDYADLIGGEVEANEDGYAELADYEG